jgi:hypothetical protein
MPTRRSWIAGSVAALAACSLPIAGQARSTTLAPYRSEAEFEGALARWRAAAQRQAGEARRAMGNLALQAAPAAAPALAEKTSANSSAAAESITNVQTAGVDEGGIVKRAGDHLVILRRGRLFTVRIGGDALQPVAMLDAFAPGSDPQGAWYDELLISGRTVVVVGYSYARGGTEIGLFEVGSDGSLAYRATHHLRSFDYYSARNYASRLIGNKLVFYSPTLLHAWGPAPAQILPAWRRWHPGGLPPDFQRILPATRIYRSDDDFAPGEPLALHTVTVCDLDGSELRCESTAVLEPAGRVFYVSANAVYVWAASWRNPGGANAAVFRLPLDGGAPSGLKAAGVPTDALSFLEDDGHLNVLLRDNGRGEGMWGSEGASGNLALLRVPLSEFGDGRGAARAEHYRRLPGRGDGRLQNRYVGDWLLWGAHGGAWGVRFASADAPQALDCGHAVERIEALGGDALLVGNAGTDLHFSAVRLQRGRAGMAGSHVQPGARQGETRTHGFFYRATDRNEGLLGLPLVDSGQRVRPGGVYAGERGGAAVLFLRQRELAFHALGELRASASTAMADACKASCVDWYGNARPIFIGERVFALLGYEIVEGRLEGRVEERRRISFAPRSRDGGRFTPFG